jgi:hypothetical protein
MDGGKMRLPNSAHAAHPWRIHEFTRDFRVEDVWALPTPGGAADFPLLVALFASGDASRSSSSAARVLFKLRWKLGATLGWDRAATGAGARVSAVRDRLPAELRDGQSEPEFGAGPFRLLYVLDDESAAEVANQTMHGLLHLGWVHDASAPEGYRGQMAVLVKPNGLLGTAYMAAIRPFRHWVVYPAMMRDIERVWQERARDLAPASG